jgi:hypothetical protein
LHWCLPSPISPQTARRPSAEEYASSLLLIEKITTSDVSEEDTIQIFFLTAVGVYAVPVFAREVFFDRNLVPLVPFLLYLSAGALPPEGVAATIRKSASAVLIASVAAFAVLGTREYLTWNRVRWEALTELQKTVSVHDIDGGFEYNGWFHYDPTNKKEWFVEDNEYMISFSKIRGFKVVKDYGYFSWMPPRIRTLLLLKRDMGG